MIPPHLLSDYKLTVSNGLFQFLKFLKFLEVRSGHFTALEICRRKQQSTSIRKRSGSRWCKRFEIQIFNLLPLRKESIFSSRLRGKFIQTLSSGPNLNLQTKIWVLISILILTFKCLLSHSFRCFQIFSNSFLCFHMFSGTFLSFRMFSNCNLGPCAPSIWPHDWITPGWLLLFERFRVWNFKQFERSFWRTPHQNEENAKWIVGFADFKLQSSLQTSSARLANVPNPNRLDPKPAFWWIYRMRQVRQVSDLLESITIDQLATRYRRTHLNVVRLELFYLNSSNVVLKAAVSIIWFDSGRLEG